LTEVRQSGAPSSTDRRLPLVVLLGALSAVGALTIDMYLPAMPGMAGDLQTSAATVQLTLVVFVVGLAAGQVVVGPLSDAWGRRRPLLIGLAVYVVGSVGSALAPTAASLMGARVLQSLGAAAATVLARAIVRDLFAGPAMTRTFSLLMLVNGVAPVVAPLIGSQMLTVGSWRLVFAVLAGIGVLLLMAVAVALPEPLPPERRAPANLRAQLRTFTGLATDQEYMRYVLAAGLMFAAVFAYISGSSFALQEVYGLDPQQFGLVFGLNGLGIVLLGGLNAALAHRASERAVLAGGLSVAALGSLGVLLTTLLELPLLVLLICLFATVSMLGIVLANATSLALSDHSGAAGVASSLLGLLQFLLGGIAAACMGLAGSGSAIPMGATMAICSLAALAAFVLLRERTPVRPAPGLVAA